MITGRRMPVKTEKEILDIAFHLFLEKGFSGVSTNEIIREAGLTKGGFYYSFKSREDLDTRVIETYIRPYFVLPEEKMEKIWQEKQADTPTGVLLWCGFFQPQRFINYKEKFGQDIVFKDFYFLLHEGMKKFPEVIRYSMEYTSKKESCLRRILERGVARGELAPETEWGNYITMILALQDGILALKVLDDTIDDEEKYKNIQKQMWKEISQEGLAQYADGGMKHAVS